MGGGGRGGGKGGRGGGPWVGRRGGGRRDGGDRGPRGIEGRAGGRSARRRATGVARPAEGRGDRRRVRGRDGVVPGAGSGPGRGGEGTRCPREGGRARGHGRRVGGSGPGHEGLAAGGRGGLPGRRRARRMAPPPPPCRRPPRSRREHRRQPDVDGVAPAGDRTPPYARRAPLDLPPTACPGRGCLPRTGRLDHLRLGHLLQHAPAGERVGRTRLVDAPGWHRVALPERKRPQLAQPPWRHPRPLPAPRWVVRRAQAAPDPPGPRVPLHRLRGPPRMVGLVGGGQGRTPPPRGSHPRAAGVGFGHAPRARSRTRAPLGGGSERPPARSLGIGAGRPAALGRGRVGPRAGSPRHVSRRSVQLPCAGSGVPCADRADSRRRSNRASP